MKASDVKKQKRSGVPGTRERLMEAGAALFAERGYDAVSVRDITGAADANVGAITYHFGSKENLFGEVMVRKIEPLRSRAEAVVKKEASPEEKLREMFEIFAFYVLYEEPALKVFFAEMLAGGRRLPETAIEGVMWRNKVFAEIAREGMKRGDFRKFDVECGAWSFFGMLSAYILFQPLAGGKDRRHAYSREFVKRVTEAAADMFMNGIKTRRNT
ncbi:MAG: TetR/AcrR family transcriptional regulator [Kiritimatiellia bacterium]